MNVAELEYEISRALESVAISGLKAIRQVLYDEGLSEIKELKDLSIEVDVYDDGFDYRISFDVEVVDARSMRKIETKRTDQVERRKVSGRGEAKKFVATYMMKPDGRMSRIAGSRDARKPIRPKLRPAKPAFKTSRERARKSSTKTSAERYVEHEFEAVAPRGLSVVDRKLQIALQREIRNTSKRVIYPQGDFQGIMKKIVEIITDLSANEIADMLPKLLE